MSKIAVLIPCYNEELTIEKVITDFKNELPHADIYVYNNNSKDRTKEIAIESGAIASRAYNVGEFLVKDGVLYKVTNAIAKDDALTVGTNIVMTTVGSELSEKSNLTYNKLDDKSYVGSNAEDYFRLAKIGNIVFVTFRKIESTSSNGKITIKKLPTELIPKNEQIFYFVINNTSFTPAGVVKNDGYFYSKSNDSRERISSDFFYFLD